VTPAPLAAGTRSGDCARWRPRPVAAGVVLAGGCLLLALRQPLTRPTSHPTAALVVVFLLLGAVGTMWPIGPARAGTVPSAVVLAVGFVAFALGRSLGGGHAPAAFGLRAVVLNSLAAVAEEAFFRRFAYGVLAGRGSGVAIAGSAVLFAMVHVTIYGAWVLPLDVAAGLVLGWQRWAGGRWSVPALTHALANLLVML